MPDQSVNTQHEQCSCSFAVLSPPTRLVLTIDSGFFAMDTIFNDVCVLVTAAVVLTFVPGFRLRERSLLSMHDQGSSLLVFIVLGLVEEVSVLRSGLVDGERIVAVCGAGLLAGPLVGGPSASLPPGWRLGMTACHWGRSVFRFCAAASPVGCCTSGAGSWRNIHLRDSV